MARVTVQDCLKFVPNRFDLILLASQRSRDLELGAVDALVAQDNDKPTVIALREIAGGFDVTKKETHEPTETISSKIKEIISLESAREEVQQVEEDEEEITEDLGMSTIEPDQEPSSSGEDEE